MALIRITRARCKLIPSLSEVSKLNSGQPLRLFDCRYIQAEPPRLLTVAIYMRGKFKLHVGTWDSSSRRAGETQVVTILLG